MLNLRLDQALEAAATVMRFLRAREDVQKVVVTGSLRRVCETMDHVDILTVPVDVDRGAEILPALAQADFVLEVLNLEPTQASVLIPTSERAAQVDVFLIPSAKLGAGLLYHTGSERHYQHLQNLAKKTGYRLDKQGLFPKEDTTEPTAATTEEEIYQNLGLPRLDPRLREDRGEIEVAHAGKLPPFIHEGDIRGDLHLHSSASDGLSDIEMLVESARSLGYHYLCITDHSQTLSIANGLNPARLSRQIKRIQCLNDGLEDFTILTGAEVDILTNGELDFENSVLADLDFVIASIHTGLDDSQGKVTLRTLKAMDNPYVSCIGHPSGRLLGKRPAMDIDMDAVIQHAAATGTALEVSANPYRLDLRDIHCHQAIAAGVKLAINTDSHRADTLELMTFGVSTALRGWVTREDVINAMALPDLRAWIQQKRP